MISKYEQRQSLTKQIDAIYNEVARLNKKYDRLGRINMYQVENIHKLKDQARMLIKERKIFYNLSFMDHV